jgi:hypothetical protein
MGLSRVIVKEMVPDAVEQFVEGKYLLLKKDVRKATDTTSIDVDATARDITLKALAIYQKALTQNSLLGSVIPSQPRPQNVVQRMYNRAYTWYAAFSDAAKTRMKWFAGIMVAGAGVLGFTWVHKYNSAAYSKVFQQGQSK